MENLPVQGQTNGSHVHSSPDRAVSSAARLADVVRGNVELSELSMVREFHGQAARRRLRNAGPAAIQPILRHPPRYVRALLYEYHFTTPEEHRAKHAWWKRKLISTYFPAISLDSPGLQRV